MNQQPSIKKRRLGTTGFWTLIAVGAIVAVFVLAILIDSAVYYNKVHAGVSVSGIDLGGQTKDEAVASVAGLVDEAGNSPITLTAGNKTWTLMPGDAGTSMDVEGAVKAAIAVTRENSFFTDIGTRWKLYFTKQDLPLTGTVDSAKMGGFVAGIAKELDIAPVNAGLAIENGKIKVIEGLNGQVVDQAGLAEQLSGLLVTLHSTTVEVPIVVKEPDVKADDNQAAQQQAETMISGDVTVTDGDKSWSVTPDQIASYMGFRSEMKNGVSTLVPFMDATKLQPLLDQIAPDVVKEPVDASFASDGTKAWVVAGKNGEQLDPEATAQAITEATLEPTDRTLKVVVKTKEPDLTTDEAKAMGIKDVLSSYSTTYSCPTPRQINVKLATKYCDRRAPRPGPGVQLRQADRSAHSGARVAVGSRHRRPQPVGRRSGRGYLSGLYDHVQRRRQRGPQDHRAPEPLALHLPLPQGPGRHGDRRGQEPALRQRHGPLHLDPGRLHRYQDDHHHLRDR